MTAPAVLDAGEADDLADRMVPVAAALACAVRERERGAGEIGILLSAFDRQELYGLAVTLAAMVPVDSPVGDLLAWKDEPRGPRPLAGAALKAAANPRPCGTRAAYQRHVKQRTQPCQPCRDAEAEYRASRRDQRQGVAA